MDRTTDRRLRDIERRLEQVERLAYQTYCDVRHVAEYAYQNILLEVDADEIKRMPGMRNLSDHDALKAGLELEDIIALKFKAKFLAARCRQDALAIGRYIAEERKRDPAVLEEPERSAA